MSPRLVDQLVIDERALPGWFTEHPNVDTLTAKKCSHGIEQGGFAAGVRAVKGDEPSRSEGHRYPFQ